MFCWYHTLVILKKKKTVELTILMPCLNEAETIGSCIKKANAWIKKNKITAEVLIADNGSTDKSIFIAKSLGARIIHVKVKGYGSALFDGCAAAQGNFIIMGDSDDSYDFSSLDLFYKKLNGGFDLVMGNRFLGGIKPGAMPWKNKYIGNPIITWVGRMLFSCPQNDFLCGLRGLSKEAFLRMDLRTTGMEFAAEMVIKATLLKMNTTEIPTTLSKDGRSRPPHLRPWRDGYRYMRFMFLYSPRWLFIFPGILISLVSGFSYSFLILGPAKIGSIFFDIRTLFFAETGLILGILTTLSGVTIQIIGLREGLFPPNSFLNNIKNSPVLEIGSIIGIVAIVCGIYFGLDALNAWKALGYGEINSSNILREISLSSLSILSGSIVLLWSLVMGFLTLPSRK
jgi:glycosyltransferase involved in cell wall biosynthesis